MEIFTRAIYEWVKPRSLQEILIVGIFGKGEMSVTEFVEVNYPSASKKAFGCLARVMLEKG